MLGHHFSDYLMMRAIELGKQKDLEASLLLLLFLFLQHRMRIAIPSDVQKHGLDDRLTQQALETAYSQTIVAELAQPDEASAKIS